MTTIQEMYPHRYDYHVLGELILEELSPLQRIFLIADGTLIKLLEVALDEELRIIKLREEVFAIKVPIKIMELTSGEQIIERKILLQGIRSGKNWLYAESIIALNRLDPEFQDKLLHSQTPIGKLWIEHKIEIFKEIVDARREPAGGLATHFQLNATDILLSRTYRVFCGRIPVMLITEKFPIQYFTGALQ